MKTRIPIPLLALVLGISGGCHADICAVDAAIVPIDGVNLNGRMVCLGWEVEQVEQELGAPGTRQDLGTTGVRALYPYRDLTLLYADATATAPLRAITLHQGVKAVTIDGLGIGSSEADARAAFGTPVIDPVLQAWIYDTDGLTLQWQQRKVVQIQLASPISRP